MHKRLLLIAVCLAGGAWDRDDHGRCDWSQWGQSAAHDGEVCVAGQDPVRELAR